MLKVNTWSLAMYTVAIANVVYLVVVSVFAFDFVFNLLFYFGWGGLMVCYGYLIGVEKREKLKTPLTSEVAKDEQ